MISFLPFKVRVGIVFGEVIKKLHEGASVGEEGSFKDEQRVILLNEEAVS
jgi:hypothetical protein